MGLFDVSMKRLCLLGSTGSIGTQTLDLVSESPGSFEVVGLAANRSAALLLEQAERFGPQFIALGDSEAAESIRPRLPAGIQLFSGPSAVLELIEACDFDLAVHGMVGAAGLAPSQAVLERGKHLALANKESLVIAGELLMELARSNGARILPVDSEHAAIAQCLGDEDTRRVRRVLLTASGGPFRDTPAADFAQLTPTRALAHPNWDMGPRISVGSATLMNKALEVIEAHHLFGLEAERIEVVVHRQSIVHSMVEFVDGSILAQMGPPDMRGPIHQALHHPEKKPSNLRGFDFGLFRELTFEPPDRNRFPALDLGFRVIREGGDAGCVLNAADEVAVTAFLDERIDFPSVSALASDALDEPRQRPDSVGQILARDAETRRATTAAIARLGNPQAAGGPPTNSIAGSPASRPEGQPAPNRSPRGG